MTMLEHFYSCMVIFPLHPLEGVTLNLLVIVNPYVSPSNSSLFTASMPCIAVLQINQKIQQLSASLEKAKADLEEARANISKPFEHSAELAEKLKRLDFVNSELSKGGSDEIDEPIPVSDIEPVKSVKTASVMVLLRSQCIRSAISKRSYPLCN